jgi:Mlc titration factor MtfA (ptsG expression regulator)
LVGGWASRNGPIALSWEAVRASGRDDNGGYNIVLHEFAHHLDGLNGELEGAPPLPRGQERNWYRVAEAEYLRLVGNAQRDEVSLLQHYGAKSKVEFFAVATECFFERPSAMRREHKELYTALRGFYRKTRPSGCPTRKPDPRRPQQVGPTGGNSPRRSGCRPRSPRKMPRGCLHWRWNT